VEQKGAVMGALALFLDFINVSLLLLRLFGKRRKDQARLEKGGLDF
jgi:FtsH-binding integral membrane protein